MAQPAPAANLVKDVKNLFGGADLGNKAMWGQMHPIDDEEAALAGVHPFLEKLIPEAPHGARKSLATHIEAQIDRMEDNLEYYYSLAYAVQAGRAAHAPNATASLMPYFGAGVAVGTPGTAYPLYISQGGIVSANNPFTFFKKQTFHRIMTLKIDADAGWFFVGNTVKFQDDPIAGIFYDTTFGAFEPEIPFDRTPLGAYERRTFKSDATIQFNGTAMINPNSPPAEMVGGLILQYRDDRCQAQNDEVLDGLPNGMSLTEVLGAIVGERHKAMFGGGPVRRHHR